MQMLPGRGVSPQTQYKWPLLEEGSGVVAFHIRVAKRPIDDQLNDVPTIR